MLLMGALAGCAGLPVLSATQQGNLDYLKGRVTKVDGMTVTISTKKSGNKTFSVSGATKITIDGVDGNLADFVVNNAVVVTTAHGTPHAAVTIAEKTVRNPRPPLKASATRALDIPPRFQWDPNFGYCGEVSLMSAGLYYGQYVSQWDTRTQSHEDGRTSQSKEPDQLFVSKIDGRPSSGTGATAAKNMRLNISEWIGVSQGNLADGTQSKNFLAWVKQNIVNGYPVTIGILEQGPEPTDGSNYDHIVPVNAITSNHPLTDSAYHEDDTIQFSDNYGNDKPKSHTAPVSSYQYRYTFKDFRKTRNDLNGSSQDYAVGISRQCYGWAITGVMDQFGDTVPVKVKTSQNYESPEIRAGSSARPAPSQITLTVTVSSLKPGVAYNLYRYNNLASVPVGSFNTNASNATKKWPIQISSGSSFVLTETILSSDIAVYRAVPAAAR